MQTIVPETDTAVGQKLFVPRTAVLGAGFGMGTVVILALWVCRKRTRRRLISERYERRRDGDAMGGLGETEKLMQYDVLGDFVDRVGSSEQLG
jgi:hypothetical protein